MDLSPQTHSYKVTEECSIQADVYLPEGDRLKPAILYIHGGALIFAIRTWAPTEQFELYLKAGYENNLRNGKVFSV